nr:hypothetical protein [Arachidicoccus ginsenosidivorans]
MGGIIILLAIIIPTLLLADLDKVYVRLMLLCTVWLGAIGFLDDYLKIKSRRKAQQKGEQYKKKDSDGLAGTAKSLVRSDSALLSVLHCILTTMYLWKGKLSPVATKAPWI